jgi:hypothetical protein
VILGIFKRRRQMIRMFFVSFICVLAVYSGCIKLKHEMTIQPVHVTVEIKVKIDKELEDFFSDIDQPSSEKKQETPEKKEETK